jgi:Alpha/beta hydrolase family
MIFCLLHSPLVSSMTWTETGEALSRRGCRVAIPRLLDDGEAPFWPQHVQSAVKGLVPIYSSDKVMLIAHSGAGPLLASLVEQMGRWAAGCVFVDAGLPAPHATRMQLLHAENPAAAEALRAQLDAGERYPRWSAEDLRTDIRDRKLREAFLAELSPRGADYFHEPLHAPEGWARLPCGYVQLSPAYAVHAREARSRGWVTQALSGGHFAMLNQPEQLADTLIELARGMTGNPELGGRVSLASRLRIRLPGRN